MQTPPDSSERALQEFKGNKRAVETAGLKRAFLLKLFEMDEYWAIPLDPEQRCSIAFSTVYGVMDHSQNNVPSTIWEDYLDRFRDSVRAAIERSEASSEMLEANQKIKVHDIQFEIPTDILLRSGVPDQQLLMKVAVLLDDIIRVLKLAVIIRDKRAKQKKSERKKAGRSTVAQEIEQLTEECHQDLDDRVRPKEKSFEEFCLSWGFRFPVTARSLIRKLPNLSRQRNLDQIILQFSKAHAGLLEVMKRESDTSRGYVR